MKKLFYFSLFIILVACTADNSIGHKYLGAKYINNPLGEGRAPDTDPLIRFDAFDCMTFVETAMADGDLETLTRIRYKDGKVDFINRNHFTGLDWIQNNSDLIIDVTEKHGPIAVRDGVIDKSAWFKKTHGIDVKIAPAAVRMKYIPYESMKQIKTDKPLIVFFIIDNPAVAQKIGSDILVSHLGFLLPNGILRHASSDAGRVVDVDFAEYVTSAKKKKTNLGIALYEIK